MMFLVTLTTTTHKQMERLKTKVVLTNSVNGKSSYQSDDGTISYTSFVRVGNGYPINSEQSKLNDLKDKMNQAVINQEFEKAAELRDRIKLLENNSKTINQLKMELKSYVEKQEFEKAAEVRDKIKDLEK